MDDETIEKLFPKEYKLIQLGQCPICSDAININDFRDTISIEEFTISGLCQKCQDRIFGN